MLRPLVTCSVSLQGSNLDITMSVNALSPEKVFSFMFLYIILYGLDEVIQNSW